MGLPSVDENWWDDALPEPVTDDKPVCPHCRKVHEDVVFVQKQARIDCECGWRFYAEKKQMVVSSPAEFMK